MEGTPAPHRIVFCRPLLIADVVQRCQASRHADLARLWQRLDPHLAAMDCVEPGTYFGITHDPHEDGSFAYLTGVEVAGLSDVPDGFSLIQLTAHRYVAFAHRGHVSTIRGTLTIIRMCWLPALGYIRRTLNPNGTQSKFMPRGCRLA